MEDFSIYHIPCNVDVDWHSLQPTLFDETFKGQQNKAVLTGSNHSDEAENTRPVSAYAMFFRERQIFAKKSFPNATFGDISRIVAAEWDALGKNEREKYKSRTEQLRRKQIKMAVNGRLQLIFGSSTSGRLSTINGKSDKKPLKPLSERQNHVLLSSCKQNKT
ncbi:hypothetical protein Q1695_009497 [Nippostrongylus brasiliensis]|nr:hypothetical protein Q1695_009497 [Nippostrongylus brasiliensis]